MKKVNNNNEIKIVDTIENNEGDVIEIMEGYEMPDKIQQTRRKSPFRIALEKIKVGQSFDIDVLPKHHYTYQKKLGIKLIHQKLGNGKTRVWCKSKKEVE